MIHDRPNHIRPVESVTAAAVIVFKVVIEERKRLSRRTDLPEVERKRLDKALKVLANATSYGIYAEMNRMESDHKRSVICHGIDAKPYTCRVAHPDVPGEYCFPPLASLITGRPCRRRVAMTGEMTLRGRILAVGGLREKLLAAARAGVELVCIPQGNARELAELPPSLQRKLEIVPISTMDDLFAHALVGGAPGDAAVARVAVATAG